jgi:type VI secretion system protein ImpC
MSESSQHKLSGNRAPRVQITYDVETGDASSRAELPFVVGVLAPLGGVSERTPKSLRDRKMVEIDRANFDKVLASIEPRLKFKVPSVLPGVSGSLAVDLRFSKFDDFDPLPVLLQVDALAELFRERSRLRDFLAKLDGNDNLTEMCETVLTEEAQRVAAVESISKAAEAIAVARGLTDEAEKRAALLAALPESARSPDSLLGAMLSLGNLILEQDQLPYAIELLEEFIDQLVIKDDLMTQGSATINVAALINRRIAQTDGLMSRQLNYILHAPEFQALEATWRGLNYLVVGTQTGRHLKIRVLNATSDDLYKDLTKAVDYDQSALFKIIYEDEFGTYGGEPYSLLIGDYELGRSSRDITLAEKISSLAAAAHAPFISSAYAKLFDISDFDELHKPRDLSKIFESAELLKWRTFRESEDSRYVTLTLPKVLLRLPYHNESNPIEHMHFDENVSVTVYEENENGDATPTTYQDASGVTFERTKRKVDARKMLWGNPAFVLGRVITRAYSRYGWTAAIRGVEGGGLVEGLPAYTYETDDGDIALNCPTQVSITDRREKELNDLGFMSLCHCKGTNKAAFFGGQTTNKAKQYMTASANQNAQVSAMLPYMLAASRFAHCIKIMMRDRVGTFMSQAAVSEYLNSWITRYVLLDDTASLALKARFPLREARVDVTEVEGKVGSYKATVFLRPHFQLEELTASIRLVANLPS